MSENYQIQPSNEMLEKKPEEPKKKRDIKTIIMIVIAVQFVLAVLLGIFLFKRGYENSKNNTSEKIKTDTYNAVYGAAEQANHVSNRVTITLENIRERADLEVLEVESSYLYKSDATDKSNGLTIWYKIPGKGSFTVDMRMAEYIIDNERHQVHVLAPAPAITKFEERNEAIEELFYKDDRFIVNGSVKQGTQIANKMLIAARQQMLTDLNINQRYFKAAEDSAVRLITNIIKALNPEMPDLKVTVEFKGGTTAV